MGLWGGEVAKGFGVSGAQSTVLGVGTPQPAELETQDRGEMGGTGALSSNPVAPTELSGTPPACGLLTPSHTSLLKMLLLRCATFALTRGGAREGGRGRRAVTRAP